MKVETLESPIVDDEFMLKFFDAWKRKSVDDIISMLTEDVVLESAFGPEVHGKRFVGKQAFREGVVRYFEALPGITSSDRTYAILGDKGFTEVTVSYPGPDGKQVTMRVCDLFAFRDGKVASKRAYAKRVVPA
jgi:ketosteroid isomerase-like protein